MTPQPAPGTAVTTFQRATRFERGIYPAVWNWLRRRTDLGRWVQHATAYPYVGVVSTTMWVWIGASALEMVAIHFLIPWPLWRWILVIVSLWGLVWMVGFLGSLHVHPHLVEPDGIRIRHAHTIDLFVPFTAIAAVSGGTRSPASSSRTVVFQDERLHIAVSGQVNVHLRLDEPMEFALPKGVYTTDRVSCWADDPRALIAAVRSGAQR
jgi:hypothetical protein